MSPQLLLPAPESIPEPGPLFTVTDTWAQSSELGKTLECPCGRPATVAHMRRIGAITETEVFCDACSPVVFI